MHKHLTMHKHCAKLLSVVIDMKLRHKIKERVNMFKRKQNENINVIYQADEKTRRAIDDLYTRKSDRNKTIVAVALISLFIGLGAGWHATVSNTFAARGENIVKIEVAEPLKAQPQSEQK